jgi:cell division septation protein DedD
MTVEDGVSKPSRADDNSICLWYKVQICVSEDLEAAQRLAAHLRREGYNAYVVADDHN